MWQESDAPIEDGARLSSSALSESELVLSLEELTLLRQRLKSSSKLLPEDARTFPTDWQVALLERFTQADITAT